MVFGGKKVIKKILKKDVAVKSLADRAKLLINKQFDEVTLSGERMPHHLETLLNPVYGAINTVKEKMSNNEPFFKECLSRLSDEKLANIIEVMKVKGNTEPKLVQCAYLLLKELDLLDCLSFVHKARLDLIHCYCDVCSKE